MITWRSLEKSRRKCDRDRCRASRHCQCWQWRDVPISIN